jgi:hypothetical protein
VQDGTATSLERRRTTDRHRSECIHTLPHVKRVLEPPVVEQYSKPVDSRDV